MKEKTAILVSSKTISLEAEYFLPRASKQNPASDLAVILCHPHPAYGGEMHNNVISALFQEFIEQNRPVIRFNFRGVGDSTGTFAGGIGEIEDVKDVVRQFLVISKRIHAFIAGYSFGAAVGGAAAAEMEEVIGYAAIAMPFDMFPSQTSRMRCAKPKLFIQGTEDTVAIYANFADHIRNMIQPVQAEEITGTDHFFGSESEHVAQIVAKFYKKLAETRSKEKAAIF